MLTRLVSVSLCVWMGGRAGRRPVVVYWVAMQYYRNTSRELQRLDSISRSPIYTHFSETLNGVDTVRAYRVTERFISTGLNPHPQPSHNKHTHTHRHTDTLGHRNAEFLAFHLGGPLLSLAFCFPMPCLSNGVCVCVRTPNLRAHLVGADENAARVNHNQRAYWMVQISNRWYVSPERERESVCVCV
jgi:ABC-type multidrug transport system fused ATPase/permease subunit